MSHLLHFHGNFYILYFLSFQIYCLVDLMRFSVMVCNEICNFLNIFCFKIKEQRRSSFENGTKTSTTKDTTDGAAKNPDAYTSPLTRSRAKLGSN